MIAKIGSMNLDKKAIGEQIIDALPHQQIQMLQRDFCAEIPIGFGNWGRDATTGLQSLQDIIREIIVDLTGINTYSRVPPTGTPRPRIDWDTLSRNLAMPWVSP